LVRSAAESWVFQSQLDRLAHLSEVLGAVRAAGEVRLEAAATGARERALQVAGHQLDRLLAHDVAAQPQRREHHHALPDRVLMTWPRRPGPGYGSTGWLPWVISGTLHTSWLLRSSISRGDTACAGGQPGHRPLRPPRRFLCRGTGRWVSVRAAAPALPGHDTTGSRSTT